MRSLAGNAEGAAGRAEGAAEGSEAFAAASEVMAAALENNRQARLPRSVAEPIEAHRGQQARRGQQRTVKVSWCFGVACFPVGKETRSRIGEPW